MAENPEQSCTLPTGRTRPLVATGLLETLDTLPAIDLRDETLTAIRSLGKDRPPPPLSPDLASIACDERWLPGPAGAPEVRALIYRPAAIARSIPVFLRIHGGGFVMGDAELNDSSNRTLVRDLGCMVVSPEYRLAPETCAPGAVEDCYAVLAWLHEHAEDLGIDRTRIVVGGASAGGGHAAALSFLARDRRTIPICLQVLEAPMLDDRTGSNGDHHPYCGEFVWGVEQNRFGWRALLGREPGGADVPADHAPARASDLGGLPPTFISVGALDLFLEEDLEFARRLIRAGVPTELHIIPGAFHGFANAGPTVTLVKQHTRLINAALERAFSKTDA